MTSIYQFKSWTVKQAHKLGITGYVTNDKSGDVSGVAEGEEEALKTFSQALHKGPSAAQVTGVNIDKEEAISNKQYSSFDVQ